MQALALLAAIGGEQAKQAHYLALDDAEAGVRGQAALGLVQLKEKAALQRLQVMLGQNANAPIARILQASVTELSR